MKDQTEKQKTSKSPLYGYRKPIFDGQYYWCNCTVPTLTAGGHLGTAFCRRCNNCWYH